MTTHLFIATRWHNVLGTLPAALTIASGDTVITETIDAHGFDKDGLQRAPEPNPMNGPIFVTGAEPGDALKVEILRMIIDQFIRPILIRKGADLPLLLIIAGVVGGLIAFGVLGIFIGPTVLAVAYTLLNAWMEEANDPDLQLPGDEDYDKTETARRSSRL